jgi:putative oxygen-independent coproporphyrinogen III oxidase
MPWCVRKCPYCDFNSHRAPAELPSDRYLRALIADLRNETAGDTPVPVATIFIGGGTPSLFQPEAIGSLLDAVRGSTALSDDAEITLEVNPGTVERGRLGGYRAAGVTRVSLGAQTFDAGSLRALGRIHGPDDTRRAVDELVAAGFEDFNLDLMYGLPGQDSAAALADLRTALSLQPTHLSHYQLTLEEGTPFARRPPPGLPDGDTLFEMQDACGALLAEAGFARYEVSAYSLNGYRCRHNLNYWRFGDYIGLGAGAHGKRTDDRGVRRTTKMRSPLDYMARIEAGEMAGSVTQVPRDELPFEFMLNALRLCDGFTAEEFTARAGMDLAAIATQLQDLSRRGLLECVDGRWRATRRGFDFLNDVVAEFLPDRSRRHATPAQTP